MSARFTLSLICGWCFGLFAASPAYAQDFFEVGDKIEFRYKGRVYTGEITELRGLDSTRIRYTETDGVEWNWPFSHSRIEILTPKKFRPPPNLRNHNYQVGDKIRFRYKGREFVGEITGLPGTKNTQIRYTETNGTEWNWSFSPSSIDILGSGVIRPRGTRSRTWISADGDHRLEAKLVEISGDQVKLKNAEGKTFNVPAGELSEADQKYLDTIKLTGEPPTDLPPAGQPAETPVDFVARPLPDRLLEVDTDRLQVIPVESSRPLRFSRIDQPSVDLTNREIVIGDLASFRQIENTVFDDSGTKALVTYTNWSAPGHPPLTIALVDLEKGETLGSIGIDAKSTKLLDISPNRKRLLTKTTSGFDARLDIWAMVGGELTHSFGWRLPVDHNSGHTGTDESISFAAFVDDSHVMTINGRGRILVSTIDPLRAVYQLDMTSGALSSDKYSLSSDRKTLVFVVGEQIYSLDVMSGRITGSRQIQGMNAISGNVELSPDGSRLIAVNSNRVLVLGPDDKTLDDFPVSSQSMMTTLKMIDDRFLVDGAPGSQLIVYDVKYRLPLWKYTMGWGDKVQFDRSGNAWATYEKNGQLMMRRMEFPHAGAVANLPDDPDSLLLLKRGDQVSIRLDLRKFEDQEQQKIMATLKQRLRSRGVSFDADSNVVLKVTTLEGSTPGTVRRKDGKGFETKMFNTVGVYVEVIKDGETLYPPHPMSVIMYSEKWLEPSGPYKRPTIGDALNHLDFATHIAALSPAGVFGTSTIQDGEFYD